MRRASDYDIIIAGGGIYGIMIALEASLRMQRVLLVERNGWGSGTTQNWLRILHGGLRYLQSADLPRYYESIGERRWFIENFPEYVQPLRCVMPLFDNGPRPRWLMRMALLANDALSPFRNRNIPKSHRLPSGNIASAAQVEEMLPFVERSNLIGGAIWHDAIVTEPEQLLDRLLEWCRLGGVDARDGMRLTDVGVSHGRVQSAVVTDEKSGECQIYRTPLVVNATGHEAPSIAEKAGSPISCPPANSWAWNILFDIPCETASAAAVQAREPGKQTFFVVPWRKRTLIGTGHAPLEAGEKIDRIPEQLIEDFVTQVAEAVPGLGVSTDRISGIFAGHLPVDPRGAFRLTSRPLIVNHADAGMSGMYSVWGIKYTTARAVAIRLLDGVFGKFTGRQRSYRALRQGAIDRNRAGISVS